MNGIIVGGWEYIWASYALTAVVLGAYAYSVWSRGRAARRSG